MKWILIGLAVGLVVFAAYVTTRDENFHYERSGVIAAPPEKIFPYISDLKLGGEWSPYEKKDLNMKKTFSGESNQVGATMEFEGNSDVGAGSLKILKIVPNESVEIELDMTKPVAAKNLIRYSLVPVENGTRMIWAMSGQNGFLGKLISVLIDCEKMVAGDFSIGIENLKALIETKK